MLSRGKFMDFKVWKDKFWKASTRIKDYLKEFFNSLLKGKLGKGDRLHHLQLS